MSDELQNAATIASLRAEVEEYQLRLAGALIASEGGNGQPDDAMECIRNCPTIASVMKLRELADRLTEYNRRLIAENVQMSNRQTMDREEIESMGRRNDELRSEVSAIGTRLSMEQEDHAATRKELDAVVILLKGARVALDTASERAGVLEAEVRKWRDVNEKAQAVRKVYQQHGGGALVEMLKRDAEASLRVCIEETMKETDRLNALDAAKFGGAT